MLHLQAHRLADRHRVHAIFTWEGYWGVALVWALQVGRLPGIRKVGQALTHTLQPPDMCHNLRGLTGRL